MIDSPVQTSYIKAPILVKAIDEFKILGVLFGIIFGGCYWDILGVLFK